MLWTLIHILIILLTPIASYQIVKLLNSRLLSPVVLCYATGISLRNLSSFPVDESLTQTLYEGCIVLAIPLLLFSANLLHTIKYAGKGLLSFLLFMAVSIPAVGITAILFFSETPYISVIAGMIIGIFTGGTPNGNAVGIALGAPSEVNLLVNGADTLIGAPYLLFLTSLAPILFAYLLPAFQPQQKQAESQALESDQLVFPDSLHGIGLAVLVLAASAGLTILTTGALANETLLILLLTTFSIMASTSARIRRWKGTFLTGEYLLLAFCVALGLSADLLAIVSRGLDVFGFYTVAFFVTLILHLLLAILFKIDRDTYLISSTAAFYGPVFIGQIATTINNRGMILLGMALSIFGLAIGNYVGLGMAWLVAYWLG